jgi:Flp pilus assembly protein TadB
MLVAYRIWQEPGLDDFNTVRPAAPLAIFVLGILALALATAYRSEESGRAWARMDRVDAQSAEQQAEQPATPTT